MPGPWAPSPYPAYPAHPGGAGPAYPGQPSRAMAGWALGLAIFPCCIGALIAIGLAITVLVRSRDGRNHGKGLAIAALVIAGLWVVVGVVAGVVGAFQDLTEDGERDATGQVTSRQEISVMKVRVGDCINYPALASSDDAAREPTVTAVPCPEPHQFEAYHAFSVDTDHFPGHDVISRQAFAGCVTAFADFVGRPYRKSRLESYYLYPTSTSWRLLHDRTVTCLVGARGEVVRGTLAGSRR